MANSSRRSCNEYPPHCRQKRGRRSPAIDGGRRPTHEVSAWSIYSFDQKPGRPHVLQEHPHCIEGVVPEALADKGQLLENVVCDDHDVAPDRVGLQEVERLVLKKHQRLASSQVEVVHF